MSRYIIDIETNGLLADMLDYSQFPYKLTENAKLWVVSVRNRDTKTIASAQLQDITRDWLETQLSDATELAAHNGIKFDFPVLKLFGVFDYKVGYLGEPDTVFGRKVKIVDTLILSRVFNPDRYGGHGLEIWGERLNVKKIAYRQVCIDNDIIAADAPKGAEFLQWSRFMEEYCNGDTKTTAFLWHVLENEVDDLSEWEQAIKIENKLADLAVSREHLGFWFDKDGAIACVYDLQEKMDAISNAINPILPPKRRNGTELAVVTPPHRQLITTDALYLPSKQLKKDGTPTAAMLKYIEKYGGRLVEDAALYVFEGKEYKLPSTEQLVPIQYEAAPKMVEFCEKVGARLEVNADRQIMWYNDCPYQLPYNLPLEQEIAADVDDIDHVKGYLISLGWQPIEWKERDITKDAKKQPLTLEKQLAALDRWCSETLAGKYTAERLEILGLTEENLYRTLEQKVIANARQGKPIRIPTSPCIRVGVEKKLCPALEKLGEKVAFASDFSLYLTYKHRRNSIAGGGVEDIDFDEEAPPSGYLAQYREVDGRIPTPAIEIGCSTTRYKHIGVANIPRVSSVYGAEMRALFGCSSEAYQFGFDFASLEARVMGHYVIPYKGEELAESLIAEKPMDVHSINAKKLGITRNDAKSFAYACIYGAQAAKLAKMLAISVPAATKLFEEYWEAVKPLKDLKDATEVLWESSGKKALLGIDGRKIVTRSKHSLLNALFQSAGVIAAKYTTVFAFEAFEKAGLVISPFVGKPDVCSMIEYHRPNCGAA